MLMLERLGLLVADLELLHQLLCGRVAGHRDAPTEDAVLLHKDQVRGAGPDIEDHGAAFEAGIVVAHRVVERHGGHIHDLRLEAGRLHTVGQPLDALNLGRHEHHVELIGPQAAHQLVVPDHLFDRERHVLLGLVVDHLHDLVTPYGGQFDVARKDRLARNAHHQRSGFHVVLAHHLADRGYDIGRGVGFPVGPDVQRANRVVHQLRHTRLGGLELSQHELAGAHIKS